MKNRNENTTIIQSSYRSFTFFETFFLHFIAKVFAIKKAPQQGPFISILKDYFLLI